MIRDLSIPFFYFVGSVVLICGLYIANDFLPIIGFFSLLIASSLTIPRNFLQILGFTICIISSVLSEEYSQFSKILSLTSSILFITSLLGSFRMNIQIFLLMAAFLLILVHSVLTLFWSINIKELLLAASIHFIWCSILSYLEIYSKFVSSSNENSFESIL